MASLNIIDHLFIFPLIFTHDNIGKFDIFPLMCAADKGCITELTLIHKNIM